VTAYGAGSEECKVEGWGPQLADMHVYVRCFDANGASVDTMFTASFTRPIASSRFGYVWANQPSSASYTPSSYYRYNSTGGANTITRSSAGIYQVTFPGLGGAGGSVDVTGYGSGSESCRVGSWGWSGANALVNVRCQDTNGNPVDSYFDLTFHGTRGLLGTLTGGPRAYVWANLESAASYTPSLSYQYNSTGGTNTNARSGVGVYQVRLPGAGTVNGHVQVTAYGSGTTRCKVENWLSTVGAKVVTVRCFDPAGAPADSRYVVDFVH
jgi:hypothetical protein